VSLKNRAVLKQQPGQDILVAGSGQLVHDLMQHGLIDEYRLMVHPGVLGSGKRDDESSQHRGRCVEATGLDRA
jgi:dihydrofolate reductase